MNSNSSALVGTAGTICAAALPVAFTVVYGPATIHRDGLAILLLGGLLAAAALCVIAIWFSKPEKPQRPVQRVYTSAQSLLGGFEHARSGFQLADLEGAFFALDCTAQQFYQPGLEDANSFIAQFARVSPSTHMRLVDIVRAAEKEGRAVWSSHGMHWQEIGKNGRPEN